MSETEQIDPIRAKWVSDYPGRTDNGIELPISQVTPGCIIQGQPMGYFPATSPEQAQEAWEYHWQRDVGRVTIPKEHQEIGGNTDK